MTDPAAPSTALRVVTRDERTVRLRDLGIARENLRSGEPPDDDIPLLAATLKAAGQLERLTVRPGRGRKERAFMALNGRRRLLAFALLEAEGSIDGDHPVQVYVETDPARQAAAILLTNTAVPIHVADVIGAIGHLLKARLTVEAIARALGYAELEIRRLAALAGLPPVALVALKTGRLTLKQARSLARLTDRNEQVDLAQAALAGHGFPDWRIHERLSGERVTSRDRRCKLVSADQYAQAGGRIEPDLFGELPPVLLDPNVLSELWIARMRAIVASLEAEGVTVHVSVEPEAELADGLECLGARSDRLSADDLEVWREARERHDTVVDAARDGDGTTEAADPLIEAVLRTRMALDRAASGGRAVTALVVWPSSGPGVDLHCYAPIEAGSGDEVGADAAESMSAPTIARPAPYQPPRVEAPLPDIEGVTHALHAVRTDRATRGLIRALADDPGVALALAVARLFSMLVAGIDTGRTESISSLAATALKVRDDDRVDGLDGAVRERLDVRRADWQASGRTVLAWVVSLAHGEKMALLAELMALTLDGREARTDLVRASVAARGVRADGLGSPAVSLLPAVADAPDTRRGAPFGCPGGDGDPGR